MANIKIKEQDYYNLDDVLVLFERQGGEEAVSIGNIKKTLSVLLDKKDTFLKNIEEEILYNQNLLEAALIESAKIEIKKANTEALTDIKLI